MTDQLIRKKVQFVGTIKGKPAFEFMGNSPPPWLLRAMKKNVIRADENGTFLGDRRLEAGEIVSKADVA